jgi:predicted enzyme related to lactoylglutathione lyase
MILLLLLLLLLIRKTHPSGVLRLQDFDSEKEAATDEGSQVSHEKESPGSWFSQFWTSEKNKLSH